MTLCPHCGKSTVAKASETEAAAPVPPSPPRTTAFSVEEPKGTSNWRVVLGIVLLVCLGVGWWFWKQKLVTPLSTPAKMAEKAAEGPVAAIAPNEIPYETPSAMATMGGTPSIAKIVAAAPPKSPATTPSVEELKFSDVRIQRPKGTRGSRLIYAVGSLTNTSNAQRLGVKVELDLLNAAGEKIDKSSDYRASLAPAEVWNFRALVHDAQVVTGLVARVVEDN